MAPVTEVRGEAVLVAHGLPSDPGPQDAVLKTLAIAVACRAPGWKVRGATLAMEGSLDAALDGLNTPVIYPFFMAEGIFTTQFLPERLRKFTRHAMQLPPFGVDPSLPLLAAAAALEGATSAGLDPRRTALLLAAHGSRSSPASKHSALTMMKQLASLTSFCEVTAGYIEEQPLLADAARALGSAVCLPFFAMRAGHVETDLPDALGKAGFSGPLLAPIGEHPSVPDLIAKALIASGQRLAA